MSYDNYLHQNDALQHNMKLCASSGAVAPSNSAPQRVFGQRVLLPSLLLLTFSLLSLNAPAAHATCEGGSKSYCHTACTFKTIGCAAVAVLGCATLNLATGGFSMAPCGAAGAFTCTCYAASCNLNCDTLPCP